MLKVEVNQKKSFQIDQANSKVIIENEPFEWDIMETGKNTFHIIFKNQTYKAEVLNRNENGKTVEIKVNGSMYEISIQDQQDLLLKKLGLSTVKSQGVNQIKAPMPGLILALQVNDGDQVKKGDPLLILEAMKMENIIKSPADGIVKAIKVKKGESVEKNQVLIQF